MEIKYEIGVVKNARLLDATWNFEYTTRHTDGRDWTTTEDAASNNYNNIDVTKDNYPEGTIFLSPGQDIIYNTTTIENVIINSIGPTLIEDKTNRDAVGKPFVFKFKYKSKVDLDVRELEILNGDNQILVVHRKNDSVICINDQLSDKSNLILTNVELSKNDTEYQLTFNLDTTIDQTVFNVDMLNTDNIQIKVWDISGNGLEYDCNGTWHYIGANYDANNLVPVEITFPDWMPKDKIIKNNIEGEVLVQIYNPNRDFRDLVDMINRSSDQPSWYTLPIEFELDNNSIGAIDRSTIDWSDFQKNGIVVFWVKGIRKKGKVIVNAWVQLDNDEHKNEVKNATYDSEEFGPWILEDPRGRKIKQRPYVPGFLKEQEYFDFVYFTEKFLNSMYTSLDGRYNIGVLEKIARIGNFNSIDDIEKELLEHYKKEFAIEVYPNIDEIQTFLLQKRIGAKSAFGDFAEDELYDFLKYVYKEIPDYNQYKGTFKGVKMILNMLGMCCKLVEIWGKINDKKTEEFFRADEINDYPLRDDKSDGANVAKLYLTSRFDIDLEETSLSFKEFNELSYNIVRIIFQVKPVTRLLRKLSYIYYMWTELHFSYMWFPWYHEQQIHHFNYTFNLTDPYRKDHFPFDYVAYTMPEVFIPYTAEDATVKYFSDGKSEWLDYNSKIDGDVEKGTAGLLTRKASKNVYYNLFNFEHKIKVSNIKCLTFNWVCKYRIEGVDYNNKITGTLIDNDGQKNLIYAKDAITLPIYDEKLGSEHPDNQNAIKIIQDENGFWLQFLGTSSSLIRRMINKISENWKGNKTLQFKHNDETFNINVKSMDELLKNKELPSEEVIKNKQLIASYTYDNQAVNIYFDSIKFNIEFDIPLGTNFISQQTVNVTEGTRSHTDEKSLAYLGIEKTSSKKSVKKKTSKK